MKRAQKENTKRRRKRKEIHTHKGCITTTTTKQGNDNRRTINKSNFAFFVLFVTSLSLFQLFFVPFSHFPSKCVRSVCVLLNILRMHLSSFSTLHIQQIMLKL